MERRDFIGATGLALAGSIVGSERINAAPAPVETNTLIFENLPYAYDALEPHIDAKTMELHHSKHHKAYFDGLAKAEAELKKCRDNGDYSMIEYWSKKAAFHGGGHFLHTLFWKCMAPAVAGGGADPKGAIAKAISDNFGSFELFKKHFSAAATAVEGSGWALLHHRKADGKLIILQAENQHKLSPWGTTPILALDVWEHAYYLKYQNKRADYVSAWWNVVNWSQVDANLAAASIK